MNFLFLLSSLCFFCSFLFRSFPQKPGDTGYLLAIKGKITCLTDNSVYMSDQATLVLWVDSQILSIIKVFFGTLHFLQGKKKHKKLLIFSLGYIKLAVNTISLVEVSLSRL